MCTSPQLLQCRCGCSSTGLGGRCSGGSPDLLPDSFTIAATFRLYTVVFSSSFVEWCDAPSLRHVFSPPSAGHVLCLVFAAAPHHVALCVAATHLSPLRSNAPACADARHCWAGVRLMLRYWWVAAELMQRSGGYVSVMLNAASLLLLRWGVAE